jgi:hypothetical protein
VTKPRKDEDEPISPQEASLELGLPMPKLERIKVDRFVIDMRVQRPEDPRKLADLTANFEPAALGIWSASRRPGNGLLVLLDAQHRWKASQANDWAGEVLTNVWEGLTLQQEAKLFRLLNNTTKAGALALYRIAVTEGDPQAVAIQAVLDRHEVPVGNVDGFHAVAAARRVASGHGGIAALEWAVNLVVTAWGSRKEHMDGRLIEALAMLYIHYGTEVDPDRLRVKMTGVANGVHGLIGKARTIRELNGGRIQVALAEALVSVYNDGLRKNKLEKWVR